MPVVSPIGSGPGGTRVRRRRIAADTGPTPEGAIDATPILEADRRMEETGDNEPVVTPSGAVDAPQPEPVETVPWESEGGTVVGGGAVDPETGEVTDTGERDPWKSLGQEFEDYARAGLGPQDTSEEEALIRELMQQQLGMDLYNQRASMGASGFASSGAMAGMEGDLQRRAAQQATQDILGVRQQAEDDAFRRAVSAAGISLDEARFASDEAYRQAVLDAYAAIMGGQPPPGEDDGGGNPVDDLISALPEEWQDEAKWVGDVNADGKIDLEDLVSVRGADAVFGAGRNPAEAVTATNAGDVHVPTGDEKEAASTVSSEGQVPQPSEDAGSDGGGHYYWGADGNLYKVALSTMSGDY